ncbi:L-serine ammonia-lyase, iron-sulfur-dependent, subunit alpha, partial [Gemmatimonadota bacterium]
MSVRFLFDPDGSYGNVYREQGADLAFIAGLLGIALTDPRFPFMIDYAAEQGLEVSFSREPLPGAEHPNTVVIDCVASDGSTLSVTAESIGGGSVEITRLGDWPLQINGCYHDVVVETEAGREVDILALLAPEDNETIEIAQLARDGLSLLHSRRFTSLGRDLTDQIRSLPGVREVWSSEPIFHVQRGLPIFTDAAAMAAMAIDRHITLGALALEYESVLLGLPRDEVLAEITTRLQVMEQSVIEGLASDPPSMQLLRPSAGRIIDAEAEGRLAVGGVHTRAAARALAVMHVNAGMGVVCAAPTAGSAGVIPAVISTLREEMGLSDKEAALALLAAGAIGVITAVRATFAAEVAGCQVEIGAAGAMAAAAVVEVAGGNAQQAADAAAISYQNTMGSVCDLVQGMVEIPCHTRNASAASGAFVCADLILGGYENPIPLDETIDAVYDTGRMLPSQLRCTALGGLAL